MNLTFGTAAIADHGDNRNTKSAGGQNPSRRKPYSFVLMNTLDHRGGMNILDGVRYYSRSEVRDERNGAVSSKTPVKDQTRFPPDLRKPVVSSEAQRSGAKRTLAAERSSAASSSSTILDTPGQPGGSRSFPDLPGWSRARRRPFVMRVPHREIRHCGSWARRSEDVVLALREE